MMAISYTHALREAMRNEARRAQQQEATLSGFLPGLKHINWGTVARAAAAYYTAGASEALMKAADSGGGGAPDQGAPPPPPPALPAPTARAASPRAIQAPSKFPIMPIAIGVGVLALGGLGFYMLKSKGAK